MQNNDLRGLKSAAPHEEDRCEHCGDRYAQLTDYPSGHRLRECASCRRKTMQMWQDFFAADPDQAERVIAQARGLMS